MRKPFDPSELAEHIEKMLTNPTQKRNRTA
jgi:hypothetical protein